MTYTTLPINQIALSVIDIRRSDKFWREGLGFLPAGGTRLFRGQVLTDVTGVPAPAATTTRWLIGQNDWFQIELFQYEKPLAHLMLPDYAPNHEGFSRCGVWVNNFEQVLANLAEQDILPLSDIQGEKGERRVCVRDPDGIFVEIMEKDPIENPPAKAIEHCNAAFRSITVTTLDLAASVTFAKEGLGFVAAPQPLHQPEHEALWNLPDAKCEQATFISDSILIEFVQYSSPMGVPRRNNALLNDQGILNIAIGDGKTMDGVIAMREQTIKAGATPNKTVYSWFGGCVYVTDPQGVSFELMFSRQGLGQRFVGFDEFKKSDFKAVDNQSVENSIWIDAKPEAVFNVLCDNENMAQWAGLDSVELVNNGTEDLAGIGAKRLVNGKIIEETTYYQSPAQIRYRTVEGRSFVNYVAEFTVTSEADGSRVNYINRFRTRIPGMGWFHKIMINRSAKNMLNGLNNHLSNNK